MFQGTLGRLLIELGANTARLQSDMGKAVGIAEKSAAKIKTAFKFAGGGLFGATLANTVKQSIQFGDEINKAAIKAGIRGKAMSELAHAAKMADVDIGSLSTALKKMQVSLSDAATGSKSPQLALAALGLTVADIQKRRPDAQFELLAQRISELKDPADRARAATELFGKAGADLLPLFEQGAAGIAKARTEAQKLGIALTDDQVKKLADADDSIKRLDASWRGFANTLTAFVAPSLSRVLDMLSGNDTRSTAGQIAGIEGRLKQLSFAQVAPGSPEAKERDRLQAELSALQGRLELEQVRAAQTGSAGGPGSRRGAGAVVGYQAANDAAEAKAAAEKAAEEELKVREKLSADIVATSEAMNDELLGQFYERIEEEATASRENIEIFEDAARESQELMEKYRAEQADKMSEGAMIFRDAFVQAWDDMINTGKVKWGELLKFMVAEFAKRGILKLFDSVFKGTGSSGGGSSGGGFWEGLLKGMGDVFAGGKAAGGPVTAGKTYLVGERGMELFRPNTSGTIVPNHALAGGGQSIYLQQSFSIGSNADRGMITAAVREGNRELLDKLEREHRLVTR